MIETVMEHIHFFQSSYEQFKEISLHCWQFYSKKHHFKICFPWTVLSRVHCVVLSKTKVHIGHTFFFLFSFLGYGHRQGRELSFPNMSRWREFEGKLGKTMHLNPSLPWTANPTQESECWTMSESYIYLDVYTQIIVNL